MKSINEVVCLVFDYGNYFSIAERLGRIDGFAKVYYFMPKISNGFPDARPLEIGRNVNNVEVVNEWASVINQVDIVVFPDSHEPALQVFFQSIGKKVYGCRYGCELEHDRRGTRELMKELGLPLNDYLVAYGLDNLESILREKENVFVKSSLRGNMETWKHENYLLSKGELRRMKTSFGTYANKETFIIEEPIESIAEVGIDTMVIDGIYPSESLTGLELKDTGYYGMIVPYISLPRQLKNVTDKFSDVFRDLGYRGAYANEVIISTDKKGYLLDTTARHPQPPTDLMLEIYENFPQIVWDVANGIVPIIKYKYRHGVQLIIKSDLARTELSPVIVPDEFKRFVKIKNLIIDDDGVYYYQPLGLEMQEIGSVIGMGNSMQEALDMAKIIAGEIKGFDIKIKTDCISDAMDQIQRLKQYGINYLS